MHHYDRLVEMIEMDISFVYFGARMKEICDSQDTIMWVRWDPQIGHGVTRCHTGSHVYVTHHQSKETHLRPIRSQYTDSRAHIPTEMS